MQMGTANYDGNGPKKKRFQIEDGDNVYRILPPLGSLAEKGHWSKYWSVVWGYKSNGKNRPFHDCRVTNYRTRMVEVESAAFIKAEKLKKFYNELKEKEKSGESVNPDMMKKAKEMTRTFNIEGKHYMNVVNLKGEIGVLKVGAKGKQLLEEEIKKLVAKGIDPLSAENGRFFNIFRSGTGMNTVYQVTEYREEKEMNGEIVSVSKVHKMDNAFIARLKSEAFDLGTLYLKPSADQVEAIVGGADFDAVMGLDNGSDQGDDAPEQEDDSAAMEAAKKAQEIEARKAKEEATKAAEKAALEAAKAAEEAKKAAEQQKSSETIQASGSAGSAAGGSLTALSDEEFLKQMGL